MIIKKLALTFLLAFGGVGLSFSLHPDIGHSFRATCSVSSAKSVGTGILLSSGYVISTAHGIDLNNNTKLEDSEKNVMLQFWDPPQEIPGEVILLGSRNLIDISIIQPKAQVARSNVRLISKPPKIGTPVFAIGCALGRPPHITDGRISYPEGNGLGRSSVPIFFGNSGGGLFLASNDRNCVGIMVRMARFNQNVQLIIPDDQGLPISIEFELPEPVTHMSEYIPAEKIVWFAESHNLKHTVD